MNRLNTGNYESGRIECKRELNDKFENSVTAFLNSKEGGLLYIGVDEQLGSGMCRILKAYDRSNFHFSSHFLIVTFPFDKKVAPSDTVNNNGNETAKRESTISRIFMTINADPSITIDDLIVSLGKSRSAVLRGIKKLKDAEILKRSSSDKSGKWQII